MDFAFPVLGQPAPAPSTSATPAPDETQTKPRVPLTAFSTVTHVAAGPRLTLTALSTVTHVATAPSKDTKGARSQVEYLRSQMHGQDSAPVQPRDITLQELQQHRSSSDAWICLKGKVYDMTKYMQYHPGGGRILLKAAGTDATQLFLKHHAWVDADYILGGSLLGKLVEGDKVAIDELGSSQQVDNAAPIAQVDDAAPIAQIDDAAPIAQIDDAAPIAQIDDAAPIAQGSDSAGQLK